MKAQSQEKDTVIRKLKERILSLSEKDSVENNIDEIETINIELEHNQFDSIRKIRVQSKEHCDSLIAQINTKSVENSDLNAQLQEKAFAITTLKNELRKLKGKNVVNTAVSKPNATIAPGMFKLDIEPISPRLKNNRDAHEVHIEKTIEYTDTLRGFVESARTHNSSEPLLESFCMFTKHVQELLVYVSQTCPSSLKPSGKLVVVTPMNKDKRVRFTEPVTSSSNIPKQTDSLNTKDSNKPLLTSTGVKLTTSASGSKPPGNTKNNRITRPPRSNQTNKVEDHSRKVKSSLNKMNYISEPISNALVKHSMFYLLLLLSMTGCPDHPLVSGLRMFKTYDREPLSADELHEFGHAGVTLQDQARFRCSGVHARGGNRLQGIICTGCKNRGHPYLSLARNAQPTKNLATLKMDVKRDFLIWRSSKERGLKEATTMNDTPMVEKNKLDEDLHGTPVDATLYRGMI
ncbi:hypothetical protein Tco_0772962 [Tanacetum coccineum]|uniref:Uncharacterized protein n=1 Tax=Tanacetum coccineum TaxID=301880 RepID=A0ABQ4ZLJ3_9ASTR